MKVIVTGAAGFIGSHVAEYYLVKGDYVIGVDNLSRPGNHANLNALAALSTSESFRFIHADIRSDTDVDGLMSRHSDAELIVHEAGQVAVTTSVSNPRSDFEINAFGTFNMLEATRKHVPGAIFLYASTNKVYGGLEHVSIVERAGRYEYGPKWAAGINERELIDFHSPYGCSKGAAEQYVRDYFRIYGLRTVVFRQSCIYGTRQFGMEDQGWVAWFTIAALKGLPIKVYGNGKQIRDLLWVEDLVQLYQSAVSNIDRAAGEIYNAGGGATNTLSLLELLSILEKKLAKSIPVSFGDWRPGDQKVFVADSEKARRELGWVPSVRPDKGVEYLIDWARMNIAELDKVLQAAAPTAGRGGAV